MITRAQKARLGFFVLVSVLALIAGLAAVLGRALWEKRDFYYAKYTESVSGLEVGAQVKYNGVRVGRVEKILIDPEDITKTMVRFSLDGGTPVKADARVVMNMFGITGLKFLEIRGGTNEAETLKPGSEVKSGTSMVDDLTVRAESLSKKIEIVINNLVELTGDSNRQRLANLLDSVNHLAGRMDRLASKNEKGIRDAIRGAGTAAQSLVELLQAAKKTVDEAKGGMKRITDAAVELLNPKRLDTVVQDVGATLKDARITMDEAKARMGEKGLKMSVARLNKFLDKASKFVAKAQLTLNQTREGIYAAVQNLVEASENFRDFSRLIKENPALLLGGSHREERRLP
ncbi:MAG: MCE family protein [Deltaproteobacteria bacterium]|nr:MCE family protein [Deltaproteobacteria bacterium]